MYTVLERIVEKEVTVINPIPQHDLHEIMLMYYNDNLIKKLEMIGRGCFGRVYLYVSPTGKEYAIKQEMSMKEKMYEDNTNDATILSKVQGIKGIPTLYAHVGEDFLIMERINGVSLDKYNDEYDYLPKPDIADSFFETLKLCLERGVFPSDLEKRNIMLDKNGDIRLCDFGHWCLSDDMYAQEKKRLENHGYEKYVSDKFHYEIESIKRFSRKHLGGCNLGEIPKKLIPDPNVLKLENWMIIDKKIPLFA